MILELLEHYGVELDYNNKACCPHPEHNEKTPSFTYYEDTDSFNCFGCGFAGDAISFVCGMEGWDNTKDFKKATGKVTEILGEEYQPRGDTSKNMNSTIEGQEVLNSYPALTKEELAEFRAGKTYQDVMWRGIRKETDQFFRCHSVVVGGEVTERHYFESNQEGQPSGFKSRICPKDFSKPNTGNTGKNNQLYGQWRYQGNHRYLLVVGGEEDVGAAHQMALDYQRSRNKEDVALFHVVSPTTGEGTAHEQLRQQIDFLNRYENIILGMDNDKAGLKAMEACVKVLPKEKVSIVHWSKKDPLEMLENGLDLTFRSDFYNATPAVSTGIKDSVQAMAEVKDFLLADKIKLPPHLHRVQAAHRGGLKSTGFIGNVIADTSVGKTFVTDTLLDYWIPEDQATPVIVSIERTAGELMADLLSIHLKKNLTWFEEGQDAVDFLEDPSVQPIIKNFLMEDGRRRFYIIDERDGSLENLQDRMQVAASKYNTDFFVIDPLTDILRALGTDDQEKHMMWQKQKKKEGWKILNVLHTRKPPSDKDGKPRKVTEYDALGSGTFVQSADFNWVLNRDKMADNEIDRNTMSIDIPKVRGGTTGHAADLYYDKETRQHHDKIDYFNSAREEVVNTDESPVKF